ncbi:uncharacterized protein LOC119084233 [Bradysia coprophila]|uniref:uncharacterized protein LOC119084233 n=1 Tax=Bradysia coprophila TaxID=38358 RepID=UPI00187DA526|nr:uncharacterized protein LOC119084233 [Bradysia coprophila]
MDDSESDEGEHEQNAQPISNYNICFQADDQFLNQFITLDGDSDILGEFSQVMDDGSLELRSPVQAAQISQGTVFGEGNAPRVSDDLQIIGTAINESEDALDDDRYNDQQIDTIDQQQARCSSSGSCCKSHQKVLNKIDYLQKKWCKEMSVLRQESSSNRQLLLQVISLLRPTEGQTDKTVNGQIDESGCAVDAEPILDMAELSEFNALYKKTFPIKSSEFIVDFNASLKDDKKFAENLFKKLLQIKGDDETKTVRKILKELVDVRCLKDFTWLGTKKMKSFQDLHLIIAMISKVLGEKYPNCVAIDVIMKVVKQRTKSAKEAYLGLVAAEAATSAEAVPSVDKINTIVLFRSASVSAEPNSGINASGPSHVNDSLVSAEPNSGINASGPSHVKDSMVADRTIN